MSRIQVDNIFDKEGTGAPTFPAGLTGTTGAFTGNVSIGGTLTYEDVTNIDSVGIITARSDISIADKIVHTGDTNTAIRFPAVDTFTVETAGSERLRIDSSGATTFAGLVQSGGDPNDGTAVGAKMVQTGVIQAARASGSGTSAVYMGFLQGTAAATSRINANGSATFAGEVTLGGGGSTSNAGITLNNNGYAYFARSNSTTPFMRGYRTDTGANTFTVLADGGATFNGTVVTGNASGNNNFTVTNGTTILKRNAATSNDLLLLGNASTTYGKVKINAEANFTKVKIGAAGAWDKISLNENGAATFAQTITAGTETGTGTNVYASGSIQGIVSGTQKWYISPAGVATFTGTVTDSSGNLRITPISAKSGNYTLVATDTGKTIVRTGGDITVPASMTAGMVVTIINNANSTMSIVKSGSVTLRSTDGTNATKTLAEYGVATVLYVSASSAFLTGTGLS